MTTIRLPGLVELDEILEHSYRDFHAKGFDYLCLTRSPERTVKAYFFEGDVAELPEVVVPHDHRYNFLTEVVSGSVVNRLFTPTVEGHRNARAYERFDYLTPLNGGDGFAWKKEAWLQAVPARLFCAGDTYSMRATEVHTIHITGAETILVLEQGPDIVPVGQPTAAYRPAGQRDPISLDGLYSRMDSDHAMRRLKQLYRAVGRMREAA